MYGCYFCDENVEPDCKDVDTLKRFIHNGELQSIKKTECCSKHQLMLAKKIRHAKRLGLIP